MRLNRKLLAIGGGLIVIGIVVFLLQTVVVPEPEAECVPEGSPSSGFVDEDSGCPISIESAEEIQDWESSPKWLRIIGLLLVLGGIATAVVSLFTGPKPPAPTAGGAAPTGPPTGD